jgi:hypothetical protein
MHFDKGQLPPAKAFRSLTVYDADYFFVDNPLNRCTLSTRDPLVPNRPGRQPRSGPRSQLAARAEGHVHPDASAVLPERDAAVHHRRQLESAGGQEGRLTLPGEGFTATHATRRGGRLETCRPSVGTPASARSARRTRVDGPGAPAPMSVSRKNCARRRRDARDRRRGRTSRPRRRACAATSSDVRPVAWPRRRPWRTRRVLLRQREHGGTGEVARVSGSAFGCVGSRRRPSAARASDTPPPARTPARRAGAARAAQYPTIVRRSMGAAPCRAASSASA